MMNRTTFFNSVRRNLFGGRLTPPQVDGLTVILNAWDATLAAGDPRWLAYMLATAHHETAQTMQPIRERGTPARFKRLYDIEGERSALARCMGNTTPGDGARYCGRGFVQLTWKRNYAAMGSVVGVDLAAEPDRAMEPAIASRVMLHGMTAGIFTGKKLADYFAEGVEDWANARRIINVLDKAKTIAAYARAYDAAIRAAR